MFIFISLNYLRHLMWSKFIRSLILIVNLYQPNRRLIIEGPKEMLTFNPCQLLINPVAVYESWRHFCVRRTKFSRSSQSRTTRKPPLLICFIVDGQHFFLKKYPKYTSKTFLDVNIYTIMYILTTITFESNMRLSTLLICLCPRFNWYMYLFCCYDTLHCLETSFLLP